MHYWKLGMKIYSCNLDFGLRDLAGELYATGNADTISFPKLVQGGPVGLGLQFGLVLTPW